MALHDSILDTIGDTPVVKLQRLAPAHVSLYVKVESFNPGGSVKDRLALADRKSTRLNSSHVLILISYAVFCLDRKSVV